MKEVKENRTIRMTRAKWESFKRLLGTEWLNGQITRAEKREERAKVKP